MIKSLHCVKTGCTVGFPTTGATYHGDAFEYGDSLIFNCNSMGSLDEPDFILEKATMARFANSTLIIAEADEVILTNMDIYNMWLKYSPHLARAVILNA